jgi:hypothetical protein
MFHRIQQYPLVKAGGQWYRPRAYGDPQSDGRWQGWLIFFPLDGGEAIAPPEAETKQTTFSGLTTWADALTPVYVEVALERALAVAGKPIALGQLAAAEYEALLDAERLETAAERERDAAASDEVAAQTARREADRLRRERLSAESAAAAMEEVSAYVTAVRDEQAGREVRERAVKDGELRGSDEPATPWPRDGRAEAKNKR